MMDLAIRTYQPSDLPGVFQFLNANLEHDSLTENLLAEKLEGDPDWDAEKALIFHESEAILGFMQGVIRNIRGTRYGYIKLMAVDKNHRRRGIAKALYQKLEGQFIEENTDVVRIYDVPKNYFMPGIDPRYTEAVCFALRLGFERFGDTCNMSVDLDAKDWDTYVEEKALKIHGIEIKRAEQKDQQEVIDFVNEDWALWQYEVEMAFQDNPPSLFIAYAHGKIKAFSAHNGNNKGTGWFGPMGTHADLLGKGIGSILLKRCLNDMKEYGHKRAIIPWIGPIDFYAQHAKACIDRVFWRYEKKLNQKHADYEK